MAAPKGNRNSARGRLFTDALRREIAALEGDLHKGMQRIARKYVTAADSGEQWALLAIADRIDGKVAQQIDFGGEFGVRSATELSDAELAAIAAGSSIGAADAAESSGDASGVH